jgi:8-oxo-dGTP pyrophosphatase MutT (NUDIX family)
VSLHDDATLVLKEWTAPEGAAEQERLRLAFLGHLAEHPDGVWKSCAAGHITASALVVDPGRGRVLLTLHRKIGRWLQTGGHCESADATLADVALREATEESGVEGLTLHPAGPVLLSRHLTPCAWHFDVQYAALAPADATEAISAESLDLRWFPYAAVPEVADQSVVHLMDAVRRLV